MTDSVMRMSEKSIRAITSLRFESMMLGCILKEPARYLDLIEVTKPADCFELRHIYIFEAMQAVHSRGQIPDASNVADELETAGRWELIGGMGFLSELMLHAGDGAQIEHYGRRVAEKAYRRRLLAAADSIKQSAVSEINTEALRGTVETLIAEADGTLDDADAPATMSQLMDDYAAYIESTAGLEDGGITGLPTGFGDLDELLDGLQEKGLYLIAGRPGMGKSALAACIAINVANWILVNRLPGVVYIASQEMSRVQVRERLQSIYTGMSNYKIRRGLRVGGMEQHEYSQFVKKDVELSQLPIIVDDKRTMNPLELEARVRRVARRHGGIALIIEDYLGLLNPGVKVGTKEQGISHISGCLKTMAAIAPVLALSQLSRALENREDKRPVLSDLRDSGALEQDADGVIFIYRDSVYNPDTTTPNKAELIVAKNRHGQTGTIITHFEKSITKFTDAVTQTIDLSEL